MRDELEHNGDVLPVPCSAIGISSVAGELLLILASFYESDASYEDFIIRALAYVSGQSEKPVREMKSPDRKDQFWRILDQQPFLLVLDGLERILLAYARRDAAQTFDDDLDEQNKSRH